MNTIRDLLRTGTITRGINARRNPNFEDTDRFAIGIANKDYPAQTPFLWNSVYHALGWSERNIRTFGAVDSAREIFEAFRADPLYLGGDVGVGFKDQAPVFLDDLDELAALMGAINVVVKTGSGLKGYNTDGEGYAKSLADLFAARGEKLSGKKVVVLGAGGTTNAIAFSLANRGARIVVINRTVSKAEDLARRLNAYKPQTAEAYGREAIRTQLMDAAVAVAVIDDPYSPLDKFSALGSINLPADEKSIVENLRLAGEILDELPKSLVISDVMLRSEDTATIRTAKERGFATLDGRPMVFNQAVEAFYLVNEGKLVSKGIDRSRIAEIMGGALLSQ